MPTNNRLIIKNKKTEVKSLMHLFENPKNTRKQIVRTLKMTIQDVYAKLACQKSIIEKVSGKKFENYKLQKISSLKYILNSETPALLVTLLVPHKGRIKFNFKVMEDKV